MSSALSSAYNQWYKWLIISIRHFPPTLRSPWTPLVWWELSGGSKVISSFGSSKGSKVFQLHPEHDRGVDAQLVISAFGSVSVDLIMPRDSQKSGWKWTNVGWKTRVWWHQWKELQKKSTGHSVQVFEQQNFAEFYWANKERQKSYFRSSIQITSVFHPMDPVGFRKWHWRTCSKVWLPTSESTKQWKGFKTLADHQL